MTQANNLKRKARTDPASLTPKSSKKGRPRTADSSHLDVQWVGDDVSYNANVVPSTYKPRAGERLRDFYDSTVSHSLVAQADGFFNRASQIAITDGADWESMPRFKRAVCKITPFCSRYRLVWKPRC
jgi:hypothetical protein